MKSYHIIVSGKVQGVFYRVTARDKAKEFGLTGWVKNTNNGDVEILASGSENQLMEFVEWCKVGPADAEVEEVVVNTVTTAVFESFSIIR